MDCAKLRTLLDAYIDGELPEDEARALVNHAKACEACGRELAAAELLRGALVHMDDEVAVPLEAQAAWRGAVRAEAKRRRGRRWMKWAYAAAAALVLVLGGSLMLRGAPAQTDAAPLAAQMDGGAGVIARDGEVSPVEGETAYAAWKKIATPETEAAVETLQALAAEYSGACTLDDGEICRIELPCAYLEDFLNAASRIGEELDSRTGDATDGTAVVYIQLCKE